MTSAQGEPAAAPGADAARFFSYFLRAVAALGLVAAVLWLAVEQPGPLGDLDGQAPSWLRWVGLGVTVAGGPCLLLLGGLPPRGHGAAWLAARWGWLAVAAATAASFTESTSMPDGAPTILQVELEARVQDASWFDEIRTVVSHDWLFIPAYVVLFAVLVTWSGAYYRLVFVRRLREPVAWAVVAAGVLDCVENALLLFATDADAERVALWRFASVAAWGKFAILAIAAAYVVGGAHSWVATPSWVRRLAWQLEDEQIETERYRWDRSTSSGDLGIALSGGGIRAASISLGALQCLDLDQNAPAQGLGWGAARVVTAISGGSNMAAGWSITRSHIAQTPALGAEAGDDPYPEWRPPAPEQPPTEALPWDYYLQRGGRPVDDPSPEERHLVDNLGYLASNAPRGDRHDPVNAPSADGPGAVAASQGDSDPRKPSRTQVLRPTAYATVLAGLGVNAAVLLAALFLLAKSAGWALQGINGDPVAEDGLHAMVSTYWLGGIGPSYLGVGVVCLLIWIVLGQTWSSSVEDDGPLGSAQRVLLSAFKWLTYGALGLGGALSVALWALPELANLVGGVELTTISVATIGSAAGVVGAVVQTLRKPAAARFAPVVGGLVFAALLVFLVCLWTADAATHPIVWSWTSWNSPAVWLVVAGALLLVQLTVSPERWSLAAFYRGKLRLAYATRREGGSVELFRNDNVTTDLRKREPYLHAFRARGADHATADGDKPSTPLVICASATVSSRAVRTHRGVPALSVTFAPDKVTVFVPQDDRGESGSYEASTEHINALGEPRLKRLTTMMAAAASSAAVSPAMGRFRMGPTSMLLTFANIRIGVWLPNPRFAQGLPEGNRKLSFPRTGLGYLAKEFLGIHDLSDPYLYVTDGGHWENTGLVEMLRRPYIREIVCVDADSGPGDALSSLGKALELAPLECNVRVWINLDPLRAKTRPSAHSPAYAERTVNLGFFTRDRDVRSTGILWYSKPGLTADLYQNLLGFAEAHADFPRASTLNQFFDTASFAAYRDLGRFNAREILKARARLLSLVTDLDGKTTDQIRDDMLDEIAKPDCHWVTREFDQALRHRPRGDWPDFVTAIHTVLSRP
jgi:hypothetical protein